MIITEVCTGCGLCTQVCPEHCITMSPDAEGFLVPKIDESICVKCGWCSKKCPQNNPIKMVGQSKYYSAINANQADLNKSSSGGMFIMLAKHFLELEGIVCGCVYDEKMIARHICTDDLDTVYKMCGSKYVQSEVYRCYPLVKNALERDRRVLFTGTACQVAALHNYLGKPYEQLLSVDILCHGVPSPAYFNKYVQFLEKKYRGKVINIEFRNKEKRGWGSEHRTCIHIRKDTGRIDKVRPFLPAYFCAFFWGTDLRQSCYSCKYAGEKRISDITVGDYWGYWKKYKKRFPEGISVLSVNTEKGKRTLSQVASKLKLYEKLSEKDAKGTNTNFYHSAIKPVSRNCFYKLVLSQDYEKSIQQVLFDRCCRKQFVKSLYGKLVPVKVAIAIRWILK